MTFPGSCIPPRQLIGTSELARSTPPGCIVEVGVWRGGSAWYLNQVAEEQGRVLHLFDTFSGIPFKGARDIHNVGDWADTSVADVKALFPLAKFHVGVFPDTLTDDVQDIAFVHCDCDQCESIQSVIEFLWPRLIEGGIIVFDDWNQPGRVLIEAAFHTQESMGCRYVRKPLNTQVEA